MWTHVRANEGVIDLLPTDEAVEKAGGVQEWIAANKEQFANSMGVRG